MGSVRVVRSRSISWDEIRGYLGYFCEMLLPQKQDLLSWERGGEGKKRNKEVLD